MEICNFVIKELDIETRKCRLPNEIPTEGAGKNLVQYSRSACQYQCAIKQSFDHCGTNCVPWNMPPPEGRNYDDTLICTGHQSQCFFDSMVSILKYLQVIDH